MNSLWVGIPTRKLLTLVSPHSSAVRALKRHYFYSFKAAFELILANQPLTLEGRETILELKNNMNRKRTLF